MDPRVKGEEAEKGWTRNSNALTRAAGKAILAPNTCKLSRNTEAKKNPPQSENMWAAIEGQGAI